MSFQKFLNVITLSAKLLLCSCVSDIDRETLIYENDFETIDLTRIEGGNVTSYLGQNVLGTFNNGGFKKGGKFGYKTAMDNMY